VADVYTADAWEGDSGFAGGSVTFSHPALSPGTMLNQGVPGTTVRPLGTPGDAVQTSMDPGQVAALNAANAKLPDALYAGVNDIPSQQFRGRENVAGPPMEHMTGYLQSDVIGADAELIRMLQSAAARAGGRAAAVASTIQLVGKRTVVAGGSGSVGRHGAPASILAFMSQGESGWFYSTVDEWRAGNPTQQTKVVQPLITSSGGYALLPGVEQWRSTRAQEKIETQGYPMDVGSDVWTEGFGATEAEWKAADKTSDVWVKGGFGDQTSEGEDAWEKGLKPVTEKVNTVTTQWASVNYGR
jgi:hypothetical protein